jgi:uncharacterized protein GlcG (DUF336 family)
MAITSPVAPPAGYALARTISVAVYTKAGRPAVFLRTDGASVLLHRAERNVMNDVQNRLHPPPR